MASKLAQRTANIRSRYQARAAKIEDTAIGAGVGLLLGALERNGKLPASAFGLPTKLGMGLALEVLGAYGKGSTARLAHHAGSACLTVYGYAAGKAGAIVAGNSDFFYDEEDDDEG